MFPRATPLLCGLLAVIAVGQTSGRNLNKEDVIGCNAVECSTRPSTDCIGAIKLVAGGELVGTISAVEIGVDVAKNENFGEVEDITVDGNCCWRVATLKNGRGTTRDFTQAVTDSHHQEKVKSVTKINC